MIKKLPVLSILLFELITYAQKSYSTNTEITGTILDAITQEPLPSASIILFEKQANKLFKVEISDLEGKFHFTDIPSNNYLLKIQYVGYQEKMIDSLKVDKKINLGVISISPIEQKLSEVNIIGAKSVIEQNATTTTINVSESALATGGSIYEMLEKTPGISVKSDAISLRGKSLSLLLDGRLVNLPLEEIISLLKSLPASSIKKIELNSNPTGKYDGQVQAILNIQTFKPKNDSWGVNLTLSGGSGRKIRNNSSMNLFYKKNKFSTSIGWDYLSNPAQIFINRYFDLQSNDGVNYFEEKRNLTVLQYTHALKLDIGYDIHPNHTFGFSIRPSINPQEGYNHTLTNIQRKNSQQIDSIYDYKGSTQLTLKNLAGNIYYKTTFDSSKNKELTINGDYYNYERMWAGNYAIQTLQPDQTELRSPTLLYNNGPLYVSIRAATADYTHTTSFGNFQAGLKTTWATVNNSSTWQKKEADNWIINPSTTDQFLYDEYIQAAYIGFSSQFKKININTSLRAEQTFSKGHSFYLQEDYIKKYINLFPTFIVEYHPSENHEWIISYRRGIRRPIYQDINPFIVMRTINLYIQGNPSVSPELSHFEEITYGYQKKIFVKLLLRQHLPSLWFLLEDVPELQAIVRRPANLTFHEASLSVFMNYSISSWWNINPFIEAYYESGKYASITPSGTIMPRISFTISSNMSLTNNWNIESSAGIETGIRNGYYYAGPNGYINLGIKKSFLENKLTTSLLFSGVFPYWLKESILNIYSDGLMSYDQRYFMLSINYKLGNSKKNNLSNRKSVVETEKSRLKE